ncbi:YdeI/OmpD-associated family protein [Pseudonocardia phyllosphaerae]|uniref:YdeI/OmpD-associated family protein n=1 Tax=Pseudonocardia phyllosphaerae TaxID=3390502 RepID=UPI00397B52F7
MISFRTTIELGGKTATGFRVPGSVIDELAGGKKPRVRVQVGGHAYRSTVAVYGGEFMIPLNADNRESAGVAAGDEVEVGLELDTEERTVTVPDDLAAALDDAGLRDTFDGLSFSKRRERVNSVEAAKQAPTRQRRIQKVVDELRP